MLDDLICGGAAMLIAEHIFVGDVILLRHGMPFIFHDVRQRRLVST
jgi:hypothetical protein